MNPEEEKNLYRELVSSKSSVYRFSVVIEKDEDGYYAFSPELQDATHRAIHMKKPWKTSGMPSNFM